MDSKLKSLRSIIAEMGGVVVAFSGGADSTLLLKVCHDVLGDRALAVTARSASFPTREYDEAQEQVQSIGCRQRVIDTQEVTLESYASNPVDRCYFCRSELFDRLVLIAEEEDLPWIADGTNADDLGDHRPGLRAAKENNVRQPLREAGLTKDDVRRVAHELGLSNWNRPAFSCLSSRVPYGERITPEKLATVAWAEATVREAANIDVVRVRHHGDSARIEVPTENLADVIAKQETITNALKALGFVYVTLDLEGFRSGSMNESLKAGIMPNPSPSRPEQGVRP